MSSEAEPLQAFLSSLVLERPPSQEGLSSDSFVIVQDNPASLQPLIMNQSNHAHSHTRRNSSKKSALPAAARRSRRRRSSTTTPIRYPEDMKNASFDDLDGRALERMIHQVFESELSDRRWKPNNEAEDVLQPARRRSSLEFILPRPTRRSSVDHLSSSIDEVLSTLEDTEAAVEAATRGDSNFFRAKAA